VWISLRQDIGRGGEGRVRLRWNSHLPLPSRPFYFYSIIASLFFRGHFSSFLGKNGPRRKRKMTLRLKELNGKKLHSWSKFPNGYQTRPSVQYTACSRHSLSIPQSHLAKFQAILAFNRQRLLIDAMRTHMVQIY
jgi:hypothetical protein